MDFTDRNLKVKTKIKRYLGRTLPKAPSFRNRTKHRVTLTPIRKKMKYRFTTVFLLATIICLSQDLPIIKPKVYGSTVYTKAEQVYWQNAMELMSKVNSGELHYDDNLSKKDKSAIDSLETMGGPMTEGMGCSWYCGGGPYKVTASSYLNQSGNINYLPENAHDFDLLTAWVPNGNIGKKINFHFKPFAPRVNEIMIWNGYIKNIDLWKANARVARFKLLINGEPKAILELVDSTNMQTFAIDPIQSADSTQDLIITLEILEIYKGTKYNDVAISEINFDGLDVHCFATGTQIMLADGNSKAIETITASDSVLTYNLNSKKLVKTSVSNLIITRHSNLIKLKLSDREITVTNDHPFWIEGNKWASINPKKSNLDYYQENPVQQLKIGSKIFIPTENKFIEVVGISKIELEQMTYTLELKIGKNFIANGLLVKTEKVKLLN